MSRIRRNGLQRLLLLLASLTFVAGCTTTSPDPGVRRAVTDRSAERLHALTGEILLYVTRHERLPTSLEEMDVSPLDPVYDEPYVYLSPPAELTNRTAKLLMYAPGVARGQTAARWAVLVEGAEDAKKPLTTQVLLLPTAEISAAVKDRPQ